jgi:hypothetical protein
MMCEFCSKPATHVYKMKVVQQFIPLCEKRAARWQAEYIDKGALAGTIVPYTVGAPIHEDV